jgi:hypothetical protein
MIVYVVYRNVHVPLYLLIEIDSLFSNGPVTLPKLYQPFYTSIFQSLLFEFLSPRLSRTMYLMNVNLGHLRSDFVMI